eukprot:1780794-Pyramimonas_sp.AAC.1
MFPDPKSDVFSLVAFLHRATLLRLSKACGSPLQGCSYGAKKCEMTSHWRRRCRELDTIAGWSRKISPEKVSQFLTELDLELSGQRGHKEDDVHPDSGTASEFSPPGPSEGALHSESGQEVEFFNIFEERSN